MRGPGATLGQFALETALDVAAHKLGLDPLDIRLVNHADADPETGRAWSAKSLKACYEAAERRIGWFEQDPRVGAMREGRHPVGYGVATAVYLVRQMPAARVVVGGDGITRVQTAASEIGQGMTTVMTQIAAEELGLPLDRVRLEYGDTALPYGSMTVTGTLISLEASALVASSAACLILGWLVIERNSKACSAAKN